MPRSKPQNLCKQCGESGGGNFCNHCGQAYLIKRITVVGIINEIFHFFTHLDKGFLYTLKGLITAPGTTQRNYLAGHREKHQKPFSMFFLCATIATFIYYWINLILLKYFEAGNADEASFFHQYMVILQVIMLPIYALITYAFFNKTKYNYAETFVMLLYNVSLLLLMSGLLQLLKLIWHDLNTQVIELPIIVGYNLATNFKFYTDETRWMVPIKTILASAVCFYLAAMVQSYFMDFLF